MSARNWKLLGCLAGLLIFLLILSRLRSDVRLLASHSIWVAVLAAAMVTVIALLSSWIASQPILRLRPARILRSL